jgi:CRISPR-associated protein Csh1
MIEALYEIGKIQPAGDFLEEYIEDIGSGYKHVFKIVFNIDDPSHLQYKEIAYEEFNKANKLKYFYKKGSPRGTDRSPTSKITGLKKTFNEKILKSIRSFLKDNSKIISAEGKLFLENLDQCIKLRQEDIFKDLKSLAKESMEILMDKDTITDGGILTLAFEKKSQIISLGDMEIFRTTINQQEKSAFKSYYYSKTRNEECRGFDTHCYICKQRKPEVWGLVGTFKSYTIDKPGMVTGGFDQESAWKNYPVCPDCMIILERGKKFLEENLKYQFCGFNYFIIPQLSLNDKQILSGVLHRLQNMPGFTLAEKEATRIQRTEERIIKELSMEKNFINFNFLFFKEEQSGAVFNILLYLHEIAPTRLKKLIEAKSIVDKYEDKKYQVFSPVKLKNDKVINFDFRFALIRNFFTNNKIEGNFDKDFLSIVDHIFIHHKIAFELLLRRFMGRIRREFLNDNRPYHFTTLNAYKIVLYIDRLKILKRRMFKMVNMTQSDYLADFFNENPIFDDDTKKAVFLEGVLAEKLLNIQYHERNSKPFRSRLNGLKIDEKVARRLLPEMINKLEEYDKNYYKELEQGIAAYMLNASFSAYPVDELSFYFTLGMSLANKVLPKIKEEEKEMNHE